MKWQIVPEAREEMIHNAYKGGRGGHRGSSAPSSPNQLGYVNHGPKDMAAQEPTSARRRTGAGGRPRSAYHGTADEQPSDRGAGGAGGGPGGLESSPLASRSRRSDVPVSASDHVTPRSPALAPAAALATGGDGGGRVGGGDSEDGGGVGSLGGAASENEGGIFATPAPLRVAHPRLAPPSTMQRPSQHMLTSSPAPFWKFADIATPLKPDQLDLFSSPSAAVSREKGSGDVGGGAGNRDATTSPTTPSRIKGSATGPDKPGAASGSKKLDDDDDDDDEETSYDLTK